MDIAKVTFMHDGLSVDEHFVTIHQRHGKGDITIPLRSITGVTSFTKKGWLFSRDTCRLQLVAGGKKWVVRRLSIAEQEEAVRAIQAAMARAS